VRVRTAGVHHEQAGRVGERLVLGVEQASLVAERVQGAGRVEVERRVV